MAESKINHGAKWAAQQDRDRRIVTVVRDHTNLGMFYREPVERSQQKAFDALEKYETGFFATKIREDAMRHLELVK